MVSRMTASSFLHSKAGTGFLTYLCCAAAISAAIGVGLHYAGLRWFEQAKSEEQITALQLVDAFVAEYSDNRGKFLTGDAPVPATFRAHSIQRFNQTRDALHMLHLVMVGPPGREIAIPPADADMAAAIGRFAQATPPKPETRFVTLSGEVYFRTIYPSIASQQSCVDCHNKLQPNKAQWHLNDVLGAFVIDVPASPFLHSSKLEAVGAALAVFFVLGGVGFYISLLHFRQLSERETAQDLIERSEERFRDFAETASDWFWEQDSQLRFTYLSSEVGAKAGLSADAHIGKTRREVVKLGVSDEQWKAHDADTAARRPFQDFTFQRAGADGVLGHFSISGRPFFAANGKFLGYRGSARNISSQVAAYEALQRAKDAAEQASRTKSEFLATVSHELRTPLNAIIGFSDMILSLGPAALTSEQHLGYIKDINSSGTHLLAVINDILDLSKAEAGKLEMSEDIIDLKDIVDAAIGMVRSRAERAGIALVVEVPETLPFIFADERKLKQALLNILSNAVKFTPAGGRVTLRSEERADSFVLAIADTGIGMEETDIPKAFEVFGQIDNKLSRKYDGTGLGLPLAQAMVRQHGGTLTLASRIGAGTTVEIALPLTRLRSLIAA
jgi:PAS domain S-box-containing protein